MMSSKNETPNESADATRPSTAAADNSKTYSDLPRWKRYGLLVAIVFLTALLRAQRNLITPFYPNVAQERGLGETGIGAVFGSLDFVACASCLMWAQVLQRVRVQHVYAAAIVGTSTFSGLFAALASVHDPRAFLATSVVLRVLMGFFTGAYFVAESAVLLALFPENVAAINGVLEAAAFIG